MAGSQMERERPERRPQKGPGGPRRWKRPRVHVFETSGREEGKDHQREGGSAGFKVEGT